MIVNENSDREETGGRVEIDQSPPAMKWMPTHREMTAERDATNLETAEMRLSVGESHAKPTPEMESVTDEALAIEGVETTGNEARILTIEGRGGGMLMSGDATRATAETLEEIQEMTVGSKCPSLRARL